MGQSSVGGLSGTLNINAQIPNNWLLTLGLDVGGDRFGTQYSDNNISKTVGSYNVLIGKIARQKYSIVSVSAGLGLVEIETGAGSYYTQTPFTNTRQYTVGIPIVFQTYLVGLQAVGLGISGNINLNTVKTTAGINLCFALGRMQTHKPIY